MIPQTSRFPGFIVFQTKRFSGLKSPNLVSKLLIVPASLSFKIIFKPGSEEQSRLFYYFGIKAGEYKFASTMRRIHLPNAAYFTTTNCAGRFAFFDNEFLYNFLQVTIE